MHAATLTALALTAALASGANAALYSVSTPGWSGGIGFTGIVNTTADTFTLTSVTDGVGGLDFWTIAAPVVMNAVDSSGLSYDVPDAWNGTIDSTWGFLGPELSAISFNEGSANATWSDWHTGWGAFENPSGSVFTTSTHTGAMRNWPFTSTNGNGYWITQPGHGGQLTITLVPAPGTAALFTISGAIGARRRR